MSFTDQMAMSPQDQTEVAHSGLEVNIQEHRLPGQFGNNPEKANTGQKAKKVCIRARTMAITGLWDVG